MGMTQEMYDYLIKHSTSPKIGGETYTTEELIRRAKTDKEFEELMAMLTLQNTINNQMTPSQEE